MTDEREVQRDLVQAVIAIQPLWRELVLVGGLVPWVYRGMEGFADL